MDNFDTLMQYINDSKKIVFFGGAGVSTASGIPDFRSANGLYNTKDVNFSAHEPEYYLSHTCLEKEPEVFFEFFKQKLDTRKFKPNPVHYALAKLEEMGKLSAVITQNIDNLHQEAGSKKVIELHGSTKRCYCDKCKTKYSDDVLFEKLESDEKIPRCKCGGIIRPDVTLYDEMLPEDATNEAVSQIRQADLMIIGGTSLTVYPAASYISYFWGEHIVYINKEIVKSSIATQLSYNHGDLFVKGDLCEVFEKIMDKLS